MTRMKCKTCKVNEAARFVRRGAANKFRCYAGRVWNDGYCESCWEKSQSRSQELRELHDARLARTCDLIRAGVPAGDAEARAASETKDLGRYL
jgi:hypothetical protein